MKALTCAATRRRLHAYHDRELAIPEQIAVGAHLEWCDRCAASLADLRGLRTALQALAPGRPMIADVDGEVFCQSVVSRLKAEDDASLLSRVREMFDDMHLVYAGLGAAAATVVCVVIMLGMMRFATTDRPDSLAAVMTVLATPLECESGNDITDASGCRARWAERFARANEWDEQEAVFALEAMLTRQGRLPDLEMLRATATRRHRPDAEELDVIEELLDVVSRSRLDPALTVRLPNAIWLLEQTTVRASQQPAPLDVRLPAKNKRA
jgi:putative zinc finger protein